MKCIRPDCNLPAIWRDLCNSDYQIAARLVREGKTTWKALIKAGKAGEKSRKRTSKNQQWFTTK